MRALKKHKEKTVQREAKKKRKKREEEEEGKRRAERAKMGGRNMQPVTVRSLTIGEGNTENLCADQSEIRKNRF